MAQEHRRVIAETPGHAEALAQNLAKQNFVLEARAAHEWVLRKKRRRGDVVVTIFIRQPGGPGTAQTTPPDAVTRSPWGPPSGPPAG